MKVLFMGTPDFAVPTLHALAKHHQIVGVITQPDKPKGRGNKLTPPPVKEAATALGLPVYQPQRIKSQEAIQHIQSLGADIFVVIAYGQLLPQELLDMPAYGAVNVHGSLLPKYRGAAPIQWAVINGDNETGVTIMQMDIGMDIGDIILTQTMPSAGLTAGDVFEKMAPLGADALITALQQIEQGTATKTPQDNAKATHAPMLKKEQAQINWHKPTNEIISLVNGLNPWPVAYTTIGEHIIKVWSAETTACPDTTATAGTVLEATPKQGIKIKTKDGALLLKEIQAKGGKRLSSKDYVNGNAVEIGTILGLPLAD